MSTVKRTVVPEIDTAPSRTRPALASGRAFAAVANGRDPSPALALQVRVANELAGLQPDTDDKRWSPRATLALAGGASLLIWGVVAAAISSIAR